MDPKHFGRYQVEALIGEGSMGRVYRAFDPLGHRLVAVKTLQPSYRHGPDAQEYVARFRREAQAAGALMHPHIIVVLDVGEDYFVMELLEGITLQELLARRGRLPPEEALAILQPLADALEYAHAKGTIHRDIKPGNVMLLPDGRPKLMDFGVAHLSARPITAAGQSLGSPSYMAPEQITEGASSPRTDLFSLAVVAYEMLTGAKPFESHNLTTTIHRVVSVDPAPPCRVAPDLPAHYDAVLGRALSKRPENRQSGPAEMVGALGGPATARPAWSAASGSGLHREIEPTRALGGPDLSELLEAEQAGTPLVADPADATLVDATPFEPGAGGRLRRHLPALAGAGVLAALGLALALRGGGSSETEALARLEVRTRPPGAKVQIDGRPAGLTPLDLAALPPGTHRVRVDLEGHAPAELSLALVGGAAPIPLEFELQPRGEDEAEAEPVDTAASASSGAGKTAAPARRAPRAPVVTLPRGVFPKRIAGDSPTYPDLARRLSLEGVVTIEMTIDERGVPGSVKVVESAGEILDHAVLEAVRTWRYEPTLRNGVPVRVRHLFRQRFTHAR